MRQTIEAFFSENVALFEENCVTLQRLSHEGPAADERGASRALYSLNVLFDLLIQTDNNLGYPWIFGEIVVTLQP